jgi:hypothetical protein
MAIGCERAGKPSNIAFIAVFDGGLLADVLAEDLALLGVGQLPVDDG